MKFIIFHKKYLFFYYLKSRPKFGGNHPPLAIDLVKKMINKNPKDRPNWDQILSHPWF